MLAAVGGLGIVGIIVIVLIGRSAFAPRTTVTARHSTGIFPS